MTVAAFAAECASCSRRWTAVVENARQRFGLECPACRQPHGFFAGTAVAEFDTTEEARAFLENQKDPPDADSRT